MTDDQIGLHRLARHNACAGLNTAVDEIGFALIQSYSHRRHRTRAVRVNRYRSSILRCHDEQPDVFEQVVGQVLTNRADVICAVINRGKDTDGAGEDWPRTDGPTRMSNHDSFGRSDPVASVIQEGGRVTRQGHGIGERDDGAGRQSKGVVGKSWRYAVGVIAITPDLGR